MTLDSGYLLVRPEAGIDPKVDIQWCIVVQGPFPPMGVYQGKRVGVIWNNPKSIYIDGQHNLDDGYTAYLIHASAVVVK